MTEPSRHLGVFVDADWQRAYAVASDRTRLPEWAAGLADPKLGLEIVEFAPSNPFGVLDHLVRMPSGDEVFNPMRIIPADASCELVFTLRRRADQTAEEFDADTAAVEKDLHALKALIEADGRAR
jgi:hypothetical protein